MTREGAAEKDEVGRWKASMNLVSFSEIGVLTYPLLASAFLDHYATGEGRTIGLLVMRASTVDDLRWSVIQTWGEYLSRGVNVRAWKGLLPEFEMLMTPALHKILQDHHGELPKFSVASTLHFNLA